MGDGVGPLPAGGFMTGTSSKFPIRRACLALLIALGLLSLQGCATGPPPTPTQLGLAALETGDWRAAKTQFAIALRADAKNGEAWLGQARAQLMGRDPEAALRSLSSLAKVDRRRFQTQARETYADALEDASRQRLTRKQPEAALAAVRALAQLEPERPGLGGLLGPALIAEADRRRMVGDRPAALDLLREACGVVPHRLEAWVGAAEILLETRQGNEAIRLLEAARVYHPTAGSIRMLTLQALNLR